MTRVALFGISANPPSGLSGHQGIVRELVASQKYDEVWVAPVYRHIYSTKTDCLASFESRLKMCKLCFCGESSETCKVKVVELEKEAAQHFAEQHGNEFRVGTIDIVDFIALAKGGIYDLTLCLGLDTFADLIDYKWKQSERLLSTVQFVVFDRKSSTISEHTRQRVQGCVADASIRAQFLTSIALGDVSSTALRAAISAQFQCDAVASPVTLDESSVHPAVLAYALANKLYG